jgi:hypothetical protein
MRRHPALKKGEPGRHREQVTRSYRGRWLKRLKTKDFEKDEADDNLSQYQHPPDDNLLDTGALRLI